MTDLREIFELQRRLDEFIAKEKSLKEWSREESIDKLTTAMLDEVMEVKEHANWKWWKKPKEWDIEEIKEEMVDILHFWVSLCLRLGITPEEIFEKYKEKNQKNIQRQLDDY
ncbi:MAG: dUTPase [Candidatus Aenigmatarchaeota archaeon]|nr:MAG: dUTPase [Candidatus Aenigmarchaeota archaeon]